MAKTGVESIGQSEERTIRRKNIFSVIMVFDLFDIIFTTDYTD